MRKVNAYIGPPKIGVKFLAFEMQVNQKKGVLDCEFQEFVWDVGADEEIGRVMKSEELEGKYKKTSIC